LADLKDSITKWRSAATPDPDLADLIATQAALVDLDATDIDALWLRLLETEGSLIPDGLHIVGRTRDAETTLDLMEFATAADRARAKSHLENDHELPALMAAMNARFIAPVAGSNGGPIAQALALMGCTPRFDNHGRLCGANLVPLADLGRARVDVVRVFSNAEGAYGSNVNQLVDSSAFDDENDLADAYQARKSFAYGTDGAASQQAQVRTLSDQVALETRARSLNPKFYEPLLQHGHEGVRQIEAHITKRLLVPRPRNFCGAAKRSLRHRRSTRGHCSRMTHERETPCHH